MSLFWIIVVLMVAWGAIAFLALACCAMVPKDEDIAATIERSKQTHLRFDTPGSR